MDCRESDRTDGSQSAPVSVCRGQMSGPWPSTRTAHCGLRRALGVYVRKNGEHLFRRFSSESGIEAIVEDKAGTLWAVGTGLSLRPVEVLASTSRRDDSWTALTGSRLLRDRHGVLWLGNRGGGLLRVDVSNLTNPQVERVRDGPHPSEGLLASLLEDREGNIWVGTQRGLSRFSTGTITTITTFGQPALGRLVRAVEQRRDGLWVGTSDGLLRLQDKSWQQYDWRHGLASTAALHTDSSGDLWIGTTNGLARFQRNRFSSVPGTETLTRVHALTSDRDGTLWICDTELGVFRRRRNGIIERVGDIRAPFAAHTDREGRVWIGSTTGSVTVFDAGRSTSYSASDGLTGNAVTFIFEDNDGFIWVSSVGGLSRFDNNRFVTLTEEDGIPGAIVQGVLEDGDGYLWIALNSGIARMRKSDLTRTLSDRSKPTPYTLYDATDGLRGTQIGLGQPLVARGLDGVLWFTTSAGLASVDPKQPARNRLAAPVRIEAASANNRSVAPADHIRLPARVAHLQIGYTALSFVAPANIHFRYILEGFDREWVDAGSRRQAFYTNLPPGTFRFRVAADNGGIPSEADASWVFVVTPTFFQTNVFRVITGVAIVLFVVMLWRVRGSQMRRSLSLVLAERTRVAREIHDTLLQSLVGTALQFDSLSETIKSKPSAATQHLRRLRKRVELDIDEARESIQDLRSPLIQKRGLADALRESANTITAGAPSELTVTIVGATRPLQDPVEHQLLRIGQAAIANAVRHANAKRIAVDLEFQDETVVLRVTDDGRGFLLEDVSLGDSHWGLWSMRERARQVGGRFEIRTEIGHGTAVEVSVPGMSG